MLRKIFFHGIAHSVSFKNNTLFHDLPVTRSRHDLIDIFRKFWQNPLNSFQITTKMKDNFQKNNEDIKTPQNLYVFMRIEILHYRTWIYESILGEGTWTTTAMVTLFTFDSFYESIIMRWRSRF